MAKARPNKTNNSAHVNNTAPTPVLSTFTCIYTNADSLHNKMAELIIRIDQTQADVVIITECFPKNYSTKPQKSEYSLPDFDLHWNWDDRQRNRGICIYTKRDLQAQLIEPESSSKEELWLKISGHQL